MALHDLTALIVLVQGTVLGYEIILIVAAWLVALLLWLGVILQWKIRVMIVLVVLLMLSWCIGIIVRDSQDGNNAPILYLALTATDFFSI
jgi:hypothetical protein